MLKSDQLSSQDVLKFVLTIVTSVDRTLSGLDDDDVRRLPRPAYDDLLK